MATRPYLLTKPIEDNRRKFVVEVRESTRWFKGDFETQVELDIFEMEMEKLGYTFYDATVFEYHGDGMFNCVLSFDKLFMKSLTEAANFICDYRFGITPQIEEIRE